MTNVHVVYEIYVALYTWQNVSPLKTTGVRGQCISQIHFHQLYCKSHTTCNRYTIVIDYQTGYRFWRENRTHIYMPLLVLSIPTCSGGSYFNRQCLQHLKQSTLTPGCHNVTPCDTLLPSEGDTSSALHCTLLQKQHAPNWCSKLYPVLSRLTFWI